MSNKFRPEDITLYVPYYNAEKTISQCIEGILNQSIQPTEILIIDDGSEKSIVLKEEFANKCKIIRHPTNRGLAAARNTAIQHCSTPLLAAIDSDVVPENNWLEEMLIGLNSSKNVAGVGGAMYEKFSLELPDKWRSIHMAQNWGEKEILNPRFLFGCNTLFKKNALVMAGCYDEIYRTNNEDRTISEKIYALGLNLLYTPKAKAWHLRQDTYKTILKSYWQWHHTKGITRGDFASINGLLKRIEEVNFGIFKYRFELDFNNGRLDLLKIDMAIPWVFCALDIELFTKLHNEPYIAFSPTIFDFTPYEQDEKIKYWLSFINEILPSSYTSKNRNEPEWFINYKSIFYACIKKYNWINLWCHCR